MYEEIRDDPSVSKVLLVDRTRDHAELSLFYPDLESRCPSRAKLRITLRDYLVTWPTILQTHRSSSKLPFPGHVFEIAPAEAVSQAEPRGYAAIIRG